MLVSSSPEGLVAMRVYIGNPTHVLSVCLMSSVEPPLVCAVSLFAA